MAEDVQGAGGDELQFSAVETATPGQVAAAPVCVACKRPIADQYFAAGDKMVCPTCRNQYEATIRGGSALWRSVKATVLGALAGLLAAAVWFGITFGTGYILAIVAIGVGVVVGGAVRLGAERRGGLGYQFLAVLLTYLALGIGFLMTEAAKYKKGHPSTSVAHNVSDSATGAGAKNDDLDEADDVAPNPRKARAPAIAILAGLLFVAALWEPVSVAFHSIIGAFIVGIALWEAWKINAGRRLSLAGPYSLAGGGLGIPQPLPPIAPGAQG